MAFCTEQLSLIFVALCSTITILFVLSPLLHAQLSTLLSDSTYSLRLSAWSCFPEPLSLFGGFLLGKSWSHIHGKSDFRREDAPQCLMSLKSQPVETKKGCGQKNHVGRGHLGTGEPDCCGVTGTVSYDCGWGFTLLRHWYHTLCSILSWRV